MNRVTHNSTKLAVLIKLLILSAVISSSAFASEDIVVFQFNHKSPQYKRWMAAKKALIAKQGMPEIWKSKSPFINRSRSQKNLLASN